MSARRGAAWKPGPARVFSPLGINIKLSHRAAYDGLCSAVLCCAVQCCAKNKEQRTKNTL